MEVKLKKIQVYPRMSEETNAFNAEVYINGKHVGSAENDGHGGETSLRFYHEKGSPLRKLCEDAYEWAKNLPPHVWEYGGEKHSIPMDLTMVVDLQVEEFLKQKEAAAWEKKKETHGKKAYLWGDPNAKTYHYINLPKGMTFEKLLAEPNVPAKRIIQSRLAVLAKQLKAGEVVLNAGYLRSLGFEV